VEGFEGENNSKIFPNEQDINKYEIVNQANGGNYFYPNSYEWAQNYEDQHIYFPKNEHYRKNIFGAGINYSPLGFGNKITSENFDGIALKTNALSLSAFFGKQIAQKNLSTWFFNVGLDINWYQYRYNGSNYTEYQSVDSDNDPYLRKITINSLNEKINNFSLAVPLSFEYVRQLTKSVKNPIFVSFKLGAFAEYTLLSQNEFSINADYHGLYNYYGGVEFDHYYDYGNFDVSGKQTLATLKDLRYDFGAFAGIGLWVALGKNNLLKLDAGYKHSFMSPLEYRENYVISENSTDYKTLLQSAKQGMQNLYFGISWVRAIKSGK